MTWLWNAIDSWFATPKGIMAIKESFSMDVIAMVKKSGKVHYEYDGKQPDVKEIFYYFVEEIAEITFDHSMNLIMIAMLSAIKEFFKPSEDQIDLFVQKFLENLPGYLQQPLKECSKQLIAA